nr:MAG TPA_asm: hypothetical protein [Caudoviricetes sp.]
MLFCISSHENPLKILRFFGCYDGDDKLAYYGPCIYFF